MKTDKNLFLYFYKSYTLAIVPLHTALRTIKALHLLLQDQQAAPFSTLVIPVNEFRM
jgi:hypothetical protein